MNAADAVKVYVPYLFPAGLYQCLTPVYGAAVDNFEVTVQVILADDDGRWYLFVLALVCNFMTTLQVSSGSISHGMIYHNVLIFGHEGIKKGVFGQL